MSGSEIDRITLELEPELRELFEEAAAAAGMTLSELIRVAARDRAERLLAQRAAASQD